jgi:malate dehydrogenase
MKISVVGAGNVGTQTAIRLAQDSLGEIVLLDIAKGLAQGRVLDLEDCRQILKNNFNVKGSQDPQEIAGSDIVVLTAGLTRKPGMTREELLHKNALIVKETSLNIKKFAADSVLIVVSNPLDLMTRLAIEVTGFKFSRVFGMGISLDGSRFANLISKELNISPVDIEPCVIGSHGEGMMPLARFTRVKGVALDEILDDKKISELIKRTYDRGLEIITFLGNGSAYIAPSAAAAELVRAVAKDEKRTIGVCAYLNGEYGVKEVCLGVPCRLGKNGIEDIVELSLWPQEKENFIKVSARLKEQYKDIAKP